jgi:hypothetical protein
MAYAVEIYIMSKVNMKKLLNWEPESCARYKNSYLQISNYMILSIINGND